MTNVKEMDDMKSHRVHSFVSNFVREEARDWRQHRDCLEDHLFESLMKLGREDIWEQVVLVRHRRRARDPEDREEGRLFEQWLEVTPVEELRAVLVEVLRLASSGERVSAVMEDRVRRVLKPLLG